LLKKLFCRIKVFSGTCRFLESEIPTGTTGTTNESNGMSSRRWPTLREWVVIYLRILLKRAPSKGWAAKVLQISIDTLRTKREKENIDWVEPAHKPQGEIPMPDYLARFLDEVERELAPPSNRPPKPPEPPEPPEPSTHR
jgi:hypothetical protein